VAASLVGHLRRRREPREWWSYFGAFGDDDFADDI
jgi:hypothetical protein